MSIQYSVLASHFFTWGAFLITFALAALVLFSLSPRHPRQFLAATAPLWLLYVFYELSFRGFEGTLGWGALELTTFSQKWAVLALGVFTCLGVVFLHNQRRRLLAPEYFLLLGTLGFVWQATGSAAQALSLLLLLEISGLCFMGLALVTSGSAGGASQTTSKEGPGARLRLIQALLVFLWASIFALFLFAWGFGLGCGVWQTANFADLTITGSYYGPAVGTHGGLPSVALAAAVLLKVMVLPWQAALVSFYRNLPLPAFVSYLTYYYPYAVTSLFFFLLSSFSLFFSAGAFIAAFVFTVLAVGVLAFTTGAHDLQTVVAVSSLLNLGLLALLVLTAAL